MIRWCVKHKTIVVLISLMTIMGGAAAFTGLERQENPTVIAPVATIQCIYPGAEPEDVEKEIIKPLENQLAQLTEIKHLESYAMDSVGLVKITLKDMSDSAIENTWTTVRDKMDSAAEDFPEVANSPVLNTDLAESYGLVLGLYSEDYTYENFQDVANALKDELKKVEGVAAVGIEGMVEQEITVQLDTVRLNQYGLSPATIATALQARNINIPGGSLELAGHKVPVQITGEYETLEEIRDTIVGVSQESGLPVYLKNVAEVNQDLADRDVYAEVNGQKALLLGVKYADKENIVKIGRDIDRVLDSFQENELYENMNLLVITNQADYVEDAIGLFVSNLGSAIVLVLIVVCISMGLRSALVVSLPIAVVICIVLLYMGIFEIPLHQVSIASLILCLSLLVANGIVANDNIYLYLERGEDRLTACTKGVKEVAVPILTSTLTTIASFLPLAMMTGVAGKFAGSLPILVSVALIASFATALTLVPASASQILKLRKGADDQKGTAGEQRDPAGRISPKAGTPGPLKSRLSQLKETFLGAYEKQLGRSLDHPVFTILLFTGILAASLAVIPSLGIQMFPVIERDQYALEISTSDGSTVEKTAESADAISRLLDDEESVENYAAKVGDGFMKYYVTFFSATQGSNQMEFLINGDRSKAEEVADRITAEIPEAQVKVKYLQLNMPQDYEVQMRISGSDVHELRRIAEEVEARVQDVTGARNVEINYGYDSFKLKINVNEEKSNLVGITNYDVASTVRMAVNGTEVSSLKQDDVDKNAIPIIMKAGSGVMNSKESLESIFLTSQITGENVPLSQIASIETASSLNKIIRRDEHRTIIVGVTLRDGYSAAQVLRECQGKLQDYILPAGYEMEYGGENEFTSETLGSMIGPALIAIALIYLILALQFGHLLEPLIIMGTIPLSFIGIIWGLRIMGYPIGFMALLGAISLMGVVVNNGIVLLDCIKLTGETCPDRKEAIVIACKIRIRPIVIGMVTTVISLVPLAVSGGPLWAPLATSIMYGMFFSTILTMLVVPSAYYIIQQKYSKFGS